jgi:DNA polymerase III sliding clamp (beta) subunit (PCNA family)
MATTQSDTDGFEGQIHTTALGEYLQALDALVDEARVEPHDGGLRTETVDPANVALARVTLAADAFETAPTSGGAFGITVSKLRGLVTGAETVGLAHDDDTRKLGITFGPYRYTHATIDPEHLREPDGPPEMDLNFESQLDGDQLRDAVEWFHEFTTHINVGYDPEAQSFWMEANERRGNSMGTDDGVFELSRSDLETVRDHGHADSVYSADYFVDIVRAVPEGRSVTIRVGEQFPMMLSYPIHNSAGEACGRVEFMQAPRIQSD